MKQLKPGDHVYCTSPQRSKENGILKSFNEDKTAAFVVYHCAGEWDKYYNYTGQHTSIKDLSYGWVDDKGNLLEEYCDHEYYPSASKWEPINKMTCYNCGKVIND